MNTDRVDSNALPNASEAAGGPQFRTGERLESGVPGLDEVLVGGVPRGHVYLLQGCPGAGKTTLALQFLLSGRDRGETVLYVTLSESRDDLLATASSHGWSMDGVSIYEHSPAAAIGEGAYHTLFHADEVDLSETMGHLLDEVDRLKPSRIVFDSLSELSLLSGDCLRYRRQIVALRDAFVRNGQTAMLLDDNSVGDNAMQLQSIVHGVIELSSSAPGYGAEQRKLRVIKLRGVAFRGGYHDYRIETGGLRVFPRLVAAQHRSDFTAGRISSGIDGLDALFNGGLDRGTTTLFLGPSGVGKSSVATRCAVTAAARGERVVFYMFDERIPTMLTRARGLGMDLRDHIHTGMIRLQPVDPAELTPSEFASMVRSDADSGVQVVVIDSLAGFLNAMPEARFALLQLHELLTYLGQKGVTTLMAVAQHGMVGSLVSHDLDVSYLSDNVLLFRYYEHAGRIGLALSVFKRRAGNHERTIRPFEFGGPSGIAIGEPLEKFHGIMSGAPLYDTGSRDDRKPQS